MATIARSSFGVRLSFEVDGERVDGALSRTGEGIKNWRPFWRDYLAPKFFSDVQRNFETQGSYVGGWKPLSPRYAAWKARHYPGKTILRRTDRLYGSFAYSGGQAGTGGVFRVTDRSAELGTAVPYAGRHQRGGGRLPQRRILFLAAGATQSYLRLLQRYVRDVIAESTGSTMGGARAGSRFL